MQNKTILIAMLSVILIVAIYLSTILLLLDSSFRGESIKKEVIKEQFINNYNLFDEATKELDEIENIYVEQKNEYFIIRIYTQEGNLKVKEEEFYKYKNTIELMKKLKIISVYNTNDDISFSFGGKADYVQKIVKIKGKDKFSGSFETKENIKDDWYYIEY